MPNTRAVGRCARASIPSAQEEPTMLTKVNAGEDVVGVLGFTSCSQRGRKVTAHNVETIHNRASRRVHIRESEIFDEALALRI